jgi:hypothetical protein
VSRIAVALALVSAAGAAHANPAGVVPTTGGRGGVLFEADYEYDVDRAQLVREQVGDPSLDPLAPLPLRRDLEFHGARHVVTPRVHVGMLGGGWISFGVPIVLAQSREVDLASGVDPVNSSTVIDGLLPATGYDAANPSAPPGGAVLFRGATRSGVPELRGGIGYAPMNQAVDDTKPTWKLGAELHFAIGRTMRFDVVNPGKQTGVSTGVHELKLWTSIDRRTRYFEGWFEASFQLPVYTRKGSLFGDPGFGATHVDPGQTASASFGVEAYVIDDPTGRRISVDLGARIAAHLEGRAYSELWEVFAFAGDRNAAGPLVLDGDPTTPGQQTVSHPGVSNIESYLETAGRLAVRGKLGAHVSLSALGELIWRTEHVISFADAGVDLPTCPSGAPRCENDDNGLVNPGTQEVNPLHVRRIDLVGHRYHAQASHGFVVGLEAQLSF